MRKPKWLLIYGGIVEAIRRGSLKSLDRLPSTRDLAKLHRCHRFTVMNAMQALVAEGWLEASERSSYYVSAKIPLTSSALGSGRKAKVTFDPAIVRARPDIELDPKRYKIEFWGGQPDLRLFPKDEFRKIVAASLKRMAPDLLSYGFTNGLPILKQQIAEYLRRTRSLVDKELIVTNGSQEALYIISQVFLKPGDAVAIEEKGYPAAWHLFESLGAKLVPIAIDAEGMVTSELAVAVKKHKVKLIYTTPLHQYPTTVTLSPRRRQELIQIAEAGKIPILEDDYDHEFHFTSPPPPPISTETVYGVYICSFSKILFPGSRLGVIACDEKLAEHLCYQKYLVSRQTDCLSQIALAAWIKEGGFERHLRRMSRIYEERMFFMLEGLEALKAQHEIEWTTPSGGMSLWVDLKRNSRVVAEAAKAEGIFFQHESDLDYINRPGRHLRIGFAGVNQSEIKAGLAVLSKILKKK